MPRAAVAGDDLRVADFAKALAALSRAHSTDVNFRNFVEAAYCACAKRTAGSPEAADALEARYMAVVGGYGDEKQQVMNAMSRLFGQLTLAVYDYSGDFLGETFMMEDVCFRNRAKGQFFTPYTVSSMMARMQITRDVIEAVVAQKRPLTICDPACGAGGMIIAAAEAIRSEGFEPHQVMLATLTDVDPLCMKMAFLQMWMKNIPAVCIHGDSLRVEEYERAVTPAALLQQWPKSAPQIETPSSTPSAEPEVEVEDASPAPVQAVPEPPRSDRQPPRQPDVYVQGDLFAMDSN
jgi:hypothetical protein